MLLFPAGLRTSATEPSRCISDTGHSGAKQEDGYGFRDRAGIRIATPSGIVTLIAIIVDGEEIFFVTGQKAAVSIYVVIERLRRQIEKIEMAASGCVA